MYESRLSARNREESYGVDPKYFRPTEVDLLIGDPTKSKTQLNWKPKYDLKALVNEMVNADLLRLKNAILLRNAANI